MSDTTPKLEVDTAVPGTRYRVVKSLGAGGMGFVYHVVKPPNIQGVLKLMSPELTQHEELRLRFFDEVRILAQLDHPNIVKVFDYDALPDGTPFYVMELLNGRTVRDVIDTVGRVPPRVAYEVTRQLLEALQAAHTHEVPVIHRDVKPENIFLHAPRHSAPIVKLIDFGVSAVADRKHDHMFVGTWSYAAPEQIRGAKPTAATDIYAAGLVLYEMLAGVGPFDHYDDWTKISKAQLGEVPAPVSKFAPWVPPSIVALIQSALEKDPKKRPRDAYAFSERLFELEWASDGRDPKETTVQGPAADAHALLAGLGATPKPDTEIEVTPRAGQVVIKPGRDESAPAELGAPTTPRHPAAVTMDHLPSVRDVRAGPVRDTFSSQETDAHRAAPARWRRGAPIAAAAVVLGGAAIATMVLAGARRSKPVTGSAVEAMSIPAVVLPPPASAADAPRTIDQASASTKPPNGAASRPPATSAVSGGSAPTARSVKPSASTSVPASSGTGRSDLIRSLL